nr:tyrosine-type recombinase/integrase [uncultured Ruminococcus sp.]
MMAKRQNGKGTLRKRKDGRWEGRFNAGVDDNGKKKVKYVLAKTRSECAVRLKNAIEEYEKEQEIIDRCDFLDDPNPTLKQWSQVWLTSYCKGIIRDATYENYRFFFDKYINPNMGDIHLKSISTVNCQQFLMKMYTTGRIISTKRGKAGTGLSLKTVKNFKIALHACLQKAVNEGLIEKNPVSGVILPKEPKKEMQTLKADELGAFLAETKKEGLYEFYFLELTTGLRLGEILALEWSDLDENQKVIRVNKSARRVKGGMEVNPPKTQASIRTITISDECLRLLIALRNRQPVGTKLMFPSPVTGSYYDPKAVTKKLHKLQERAGIPQIRFHDLRHSFATLSIEQGMDIKTISHMLGHTDAGFTMNTYMHVTDTMQQKVADTMGDLLKEKEKSPKKKVVKIGA